MGKVTDASVALAEAFFRSIPANQKKKMSEGEWENSLKRFHREALEIRKRYGLGFLSRALATYQFQKRLFAAGFDADIVRKVVFSLVLNAFVSKA